MAASLAAARDALYELLATDADGSPTPELLGLGVERVYKYEPIRTEARLAVVIVAEGMTPTEYVLAVTIYRGLSKNDIDGDAAQRDIDDVVMVVDQLIGEAAVYGPSIFTIRYDRELGQFLAETRLEAPREDSTFS